MADQPTNIRRALWETAFNDLTALTQKLDRCRPEDRDALERALADQEDDLLNTSAPSFEAVRIKAELMFGDLLGLDPETEYRRLLLEDLSDLIAENRLLLGEAG